MASLIKFTLSITFPGIRDDPFDVPVECAAEDPLLDVLASSTGCDNRSLFIVDPNFSMKPQTISASCADKTVGASNIGNDSYVECKIVKGRDTGSASALSAPKNSPASSFSISAPASGGSGAVEM